MFIYKIQHLRILSPDQQSKRSECPPVWFSRVEYWAHICRPNLIYQLLCILSLPPKTVPPNCPACIEEPPVCAHIEKRMDWINRYSNNNGNSKSPHANWNSPDMCHCGISHVIFNSTLFCILIDRCEELKVLLLEIMQFASHDVRVRWIYNSIITFV